MSDSLVTSSHMDCDKLHSFLDAAERIAVSDYQPTDDDIIRARLRTLGVQEYRFTFEKGELHHIQAMHFRMSLFQAVLRDRSGDSMT